MNGCLEASQEVLSLSGREAQAQRPQFDPLEALDMGRCFWYRYIGHGACGPVLNCHNRQDLSRRLLDSFRDGGGLGPLSRPSRSPTLAPAPAPLAADPAIAAVYQNHQEPRELRRMLADVENMLVA